MFSIISRKNKMNTFTLVTVPNLLKCSFNLEIVLNSTGILRISRVVEFEFEPSGFCPENSKEILCKENRSIEYLQGRLRLCARRSLGYGVVVTCRRVRTIGPPPTEIRINFFKNSFSSFYLNHSISIDVPTATVRHSSPQ